MRESFRVVLKWPVEAINDYREWYLQAVQEDESTKAFDQDPQVSWEFAIEGGLSTPPARLVLWADDWFDVDPLAQSILHILTKYELPAVGFAWLREADHWQDNGGGAVWISRHSGYEVFDTHTWLTRMHEEEMKKRDK